MGCDIHLFTEVKRTIKNTLVWKNSDSWTINPYFGHDEGEKMLSIIPIWEGRDYSLFSQLADVRTRGDVNMISEAKGIPQDASEVYKSECINWDGDGHSHSYLTLAELISFWEENKTFTQTGLLNRKQRDLLDLGISPSEWCQGTNQHDYEHREWEAENESLKSLITSMIGLRQKHFYFNEDGITPSLHDEKIRIVFFFDN